MSQATQAILEALQAKRAFYIIQTNGKACKIPVNVKGDK